MNKKTTIAFILTILSAGVILQTINQKTDHREISNQSINWSVNTTIPSLQQIQEQEQKDVNDFCKSQSEGYDYGKISATRTKAVIFCYPTNRVQTHTQFSWISYMTWKDNNHSN